LSLKRKLILPFHALKKKSLMTPESIRTQKGFCLLADPNVSVTDYV
jgi:hypothetical protein